MTITTHGLEVSTEELEALHKTLGIAISNLLNKSSRTIGSPIHDQVASELSLLSGIQQEVLGILAKYNS